MRKLLVCVSLAAVLAGCHVSVGGNDSSGASGEGGSADAGRPAQASAELAGITSGDLQAAATDPAVRHFYEARNWSPVWTRKQSDDLKAAIADAPRHALRPESFFAETKAGATPAQREAAMTKAALDYGRALAFGMVDPVKLFDHYTVPKWKVDVAAGLGQAVDKGAVRAWLASLAPADAEYKALSDSFLRYRQAAAGPNQATIPNGDKIHAGDKDPRLPQIEAALRLRGYRGPQAAAPAPAAGQAAAPAYTADMVSAVKQVQADYGIRPDGVIGDSTLEALNNGSAERARIIAVNLERRRWLDRSPPATRIDVNTAGTFLDYWRAGALAHHAKVVDGQTDWETPQLGSPIVRLVANPDWTIPDTIAAKEIRPKGAAYMARQHIVTKNGRLVQESGPTNSLGLVKFDMLNDQSIYLHDTPAKALFASEERHSSHGCVRVDDAVGFARLVANDQGMLDPFNQALASGKQTNVQLKQAIPVRLLYHSAYLDGGKVVFRPDPYGWDDKVAAALGMGGAVRHRTIKHVEDVGP